MKRSLLLLLIAFSFSSCRENVTEVKIYPIIDALTTSDIFKVKVNGHEVWSEKFLTSMEIDSLPDWFTNTPYTGVQQEIHFASFGTDDSVTVTIEVPQEIMEAKVRPISRGYEVTKNGNMITFTLPGPDKLYIEIDNYPPLCLFADPLETETFTANDKDVIFFGEGVHYPGYITPVSGQTIYLAPGALVYGGLRIKDVENVKVLGRGILDGGFEFSRMVLIDDSDQIRIEGITIRNGDSWTNTVTNCTNVVYDHVKVVSFGPGGDGINPLGTRNMTISNSFLRCTDDCIAIKSPKPDHVVKDIFIRNNTMVGFAFSDGVTIGFETNGPSISNVYVENNDILLARGGSRVDGHSGFSIVCDGPAEIYDIFYNNIRVEQAEPKLFEAIITEGKRYGDDPPGSIRDIQLSNVIWFHDGIINLQGFSADNMIRNITFTNCSVAGEPLDEVQERVIRKNEFVFNNHFNTNP